MGSVPAQRGCAPGLTFPQVAANDAKAKERQAAARTVACGNAECHVKTRVCAHARRRDVTVQPRYPKERAALRSGVGCWGEMVFEIEKTLGWIVAGATVPTRGHFLA
jgi:hypothetical protein